MVGKDNDYRIFVGGLSWEVTERQLEDAFGRFGKIIDAQIMMERDTGRPRGFGFLTFADRRAMDDAIREMHGREFGDRAITVNKAQPKLAEDSDHGGYGGGGYSSRGRDNYGGGGDRAVGQDGCFNCGRPGHWARDCPSAPAGRGSRPFSPPRSRFGGGGRGGGRGDRYAGERDRFINDRYDRGGRHGDRDRYESRDDRYGSRDRYTSDRYPPPPAADRYGGGGDRYPVNGYGKERGYDRDGGQRGGGGGDKYGSGGPARYEGRSYRDRPAPYDRGSRRPGGVVPPPAFDRY